MSAKRIRKSTKAEQAIAAEFGINPATAHLWLAGENNVLTKAARILQTLRRAGLTKEYYASSFPLLMELETPVSVKEPLDPWQPGLMMDWVVFAGKVRMARFEFLCADTPGTRKKLLRSIRDEAGAAARFASHLSTCPPGAWGTTESRAQKAKETQRRLTTA